MRIKYFDTGLVVFYIILSCSIIKWMLVLCGLRVPSNISTAIMIAWGSICFSSFYFQTKYLPFGPMNIRKPVMSEEEKLKKNLREVLRGANFDRPLHILIEEEMGLDAFATGNDTILISKGMIDQFSEGEIKGVLAHELGHLISRDCMVYAAFVMANNLTRFISLICRKIVGKRFLGLLFSKSVLLRIAFIGVLLVAGYACNVHHHFIRTLIFLVCLKLFWVLEPIFVFLGLIISRYTEYRQDAFAHSLGYGRELQQALYRLAKDAVQPVNVLHIILVGTHPVIYNRIRRLEKLEGIR